MPSWSIHLKIGKELNKKLNIDNDRFMFGSLLPDTDSTWCLRRRDAHYYGNLKFPKCPSENMIDINSFLNDYKDKLNDSLIIGYYCHLLTDNFYNEYIYYNKWVQENNDVVGIRMIDGKIIDISSDYRITLKYKHKDLELYGKYIFNSEQLYLPKSKEKIDKSIHLLKNNFLSEKNVSDRIDYLNNEFIDFNKLSEDEINNKHNYELFTKDELDELLENCINYLISELKKVGVINE